MESFALMGEKLGHSLSPQIHRLFFQILALPGEYGLEEIPRGNVKTAFVRLKAYYRGLNVTIPYKEEILPLLAALSAEVEAIGAVNTVCFRTEGSCGYNTDYHGFAALLAENQIPIFGENIVVLGSGGAAKAVVKVLTDKGAGEITIVSRDTLAAKNSFAGQAMHGGLFFSPYDELARQSGKIIINCTPVGMFPNSADSPLQEAVVAKQKAVVDLIYNPRQTRLLQQAESAGLPWTNGLYMLVAQAIAAEEIWWGRKFAERELTAEIMKRLNGGAL